MAPNLYECLDPACDSQQDAKVGRFRKFIKRDIAKAAPCLEIGPCFCPIVPKAEGYNVTIVDHADRETLVGKYRSHGVNVAAIEPVDVIWSCAPLSSLLQGKKFSAIVGSHFIEHAPDFIGFLNEFSSLLAENGAIYLIVPDKRYCFDCFQPLSDAAKVIADHRAKRTRHSFESFYRNASSVRVNNDISWTQEPVRSAEFLSGTPPDWLTKVDASAAASGYIDCHENYFTPASFALLIEELRYLGLIDLSIDLATRSRGCEFLVKLSRTAGPAPARAAFEQSAMALNKRILQEYAELYAFWQAAEPRPEESPGVIGRIGRWAARLKRRTAG
jgi:2-polyprenyl-3-methyl-5-hydroxy-6-metoxy-1,4-benzoquinol methylase